jgi:predicted histone-like DNA-binding protein
MPVKYTLSLKGNPGNPDAPKKYYAQTKSTGDITLKEIGREIAENSTTVSDTDVLAVLNDLTKALNRHLKAGKIVRFSDFGTFQINIKSEGAETEEKFNQKTMITEVKVTFRPGSDVTEMLNNIKFEKL